MISTIYLPGKNLCEKSQKKKRATSGLEGEFKQNMFGKFNEAKKPKPYSPNTRLNLMTFLSHSVHTEDCIEAVKTLHNTISRKVCRQINVWISMGIQTNEGSFFSESNNNKILLHIYHLKKKKKLSLPDNNYSLLNC